MIILIISMSLQEMGEGFFRGVGGWVGGLFTLLFRTVQLFAHNPD